MGNRRPFENDEWYHCFNRGVDKRKIFISGSDYRRFLLLLYISNGKQKIHISNLKNADFEHVVTHIPVRQGEQLVEIGAYCLMPNHFHIIMREIASGGIPLFMQKVLTGYTMYFNKKYTRTGPLLAGVFKSKHLNDDLYFKHAWAYVHLNPAELFDRGWKKGLGESAVISEKLKKYRYSSLPDFSGETRPHGSIISKSVYELFDEIPTVEEMVADAHEYYEESAVTAQQGETLM